MDFSANQPAGFGSSRPPVLNAPLNNLSLAREPWSRLAALYRHVCILNALGHEPEAARSYADEFCPAVDEARHQYGAETISEGNLETLRALEHDRVSNAATLAHVIRPFLDDGPESTTATQSHRPLKPPQPASIQRVKNCPPDIADMLDEMLSQKRHRNIA